MHQSRTLTACNIKEVIKNLLENEMYARKCRRCILSSNKREMWGYSDYREYIGTEKYKENALGLKCTMCREEKCGVHRC